MQNNSENMGQIPALLSLLTLIETFPKKFFTEEMDRTDPGGPGYDVDTVQNLYYHYKTGVENGVIPWYNADAFGWDDNPPAEYLEKMTSFDRRTVDHFLWNLDVLVTNGAIDPIYLQILRPESHPWEQTKKSVKDVGTFGWDVWKKMIWVVGGIGAVVAVAYVAGPRLIAAYGKEKRSK